MREGMNKAIGYIVLKKGDALVAENLIRAIDISDSPQDAVGNAECETGDTIFKITLIVEVYGILEEEIPKNEG